MHWWRNASSGTGMAGEKEEDSSEDGIIKECCSKQQGFFQNDISVYFVNL
jgi:hypothetical protein